MKKEWGISHSFFLICIFKKEGWLAPLLFFRSKNLIRKEEINLPKNNKKGARDARTIAYAAYYLSNKATIRETATYFDVSKSTVHKYFLDFLAAESADESEEELKHLLVEQLELNKELRTIRGGDATRMMYLQKKSKSLDLF